MKLFEKCQKAFSFLSGLFRQIELYFTLHGPKADGQYSVFLSHLPPIQTLFERLSWERFQTKHLLLYLGIHCPLSENDLNQAKIHFEKLGNSSRPLYVLFPGLEQLKKLATLTQNCRDWWILTQSQKPTDERLKDLGIIAGPAAFSTTPPKIQGENLFNYFFDPSFFSSNPEDFRVIVQELFSWGFSKLYPEDQPPPGLKNLDPFKHLGLDVPLPIPGNTSNASALKMHSFIIRGSKQPRIYRLDWPGGKKHHILWQQTNWSPLVFRRPSSITVFFRIFVKYLPVIFLIPADHPCP